MNILALEFSSSQRSVAVLNRTAGTFVASEIVETGAGAMRLATMVDAALRKANLERGQIECLAVGMGPGSYTGIRAAISFAQGWHLASGVKLLGISSADAIAASARADGYTGTAGIVIDAQRDEIYLAGYDLGGAALRVITPLRIAAPAEAQALQNAGATLFGPDVKRWFAGANVVFPRASLIGQLALARIDFVPGEKLEPIYLRQVAFAKAPPARVLPS